MCGLLHFFANGYGKRTAAFAGTATETFAGFVSHCVVFLLHFWGDFAFGFGLVKELVYLVNVDAGRTWCAVGAVEAFSLPISCL